MSKKKINKIDTNDKHVIHRNEKIKGYDLRMCLASPLRFQPLESGKNMCRGPKRKGPPPLPSLGPNSLAFMEGGEKTMQKCLCQAKRATGGQFIGRNMFTRRVIKAFKLFDEGPDKKERGEKKHNRKCAGVYFLDCEVKAFSIQRTM